MDRRKTGAILCAGWSGCKNNIRDAPNKNKEQNWEIKYDVW
jgi:hypothetical protein